MDRPLVAVVLAGGTGTRLYPASRSDRPKQFLDFGGEQSLLAETIDRADFADEVYVLTRPDFADAVRDYAPRAGVLTEPEPRDTGPALVYAAHRIREQVGDCVLCSLPSDHHVRGEFAATMEQAAGVAVEAGGLVTVGIEPTRPATGYGYIKPGEPRGGAYTVEQFVEKPDAETASHYVEDGFYWNAGIFAWTPNALLSAARQTVLEPLVDALDDGNPSQGFDAVESISVDHAILETTGRAYVVPASFAWDDLGSWDAFERVFDDDGQGNVVLGDALLDSTENCIVATDGHVSTVGVSDLVVASYGDRTLVLPKAEAQRVRDIVSQLREQDLF